jgi:RNA polymerase sigma factor (sigma-70 family)
MGSSKEERSAVKPLMVAAPSEATDNQLVDAARRGSDVAFEALFRRYRDRITAYVRSILSDHARAEDIVQDVFMSALRSMRSTDREVIFKPWVYEIAKNACIDHIRKARRASEVSIDSEDFSPIDEGRLSAGVATTDSAYAARENLDTLKMAFHDLPQAQREVLVSRELEGLSYDTISSRTGLSRSAVESMLFRARRTLKDGYDDIATGERCQRMQTVMTHLIDGQIGLRQERRLVRHLHDCVPCRREAVALGLDDLLFAAPSRTRAALSRVAAFLPLPAFLRRRWADGAGLLGSAGSSGAAEQGASFVSKAAIMLAAAAIAGGSAGVAQQTGVIGHGGKSVRTPAGHGPSRVVNSSQGSAPVSGRSGGVRSGTGKAGTAGGRGSAGANAPGGGSGAGAGSGGDRGVNPRGPLGNPGSAVGGAAGQAGSAVGGTVNGAAGGLGNGAGGTLGTTVKGVGGTVDNLGGTVDSTTKAVGGTTDDTVKSVGGTVDGAVRSLGGTVDRTVTSIGGTVNGITGPATAPVQPPALLPGTPRLTP